MSDLIIVCMVLCTGKEQEYGQMQYGNQNCVTEVIWLTTKTAQRGGRGTWNSHDTFDRDPLHALPNALCDEIVEVCRQTVSVNQCDFTSETNYSIPLEVVTNHSHFI